MHRLYSINTLKKHLQLSRDKGSRVGFVPTMGALHEGHLALVEKAKEECDVVMVSIFVNPTQFNNTSDLDNYPKREEEDLTLLEDAHCDVVFIPTVEEIYPPGYEKVHVELGKVEKIMEGEHRPGHFNGVVNVVSRFFEIIEPNKAYFGRKDFQQVIAMKEMTKQLHLPVEIVAVETKRFSSGLAMSSRNYRLSNKELDQAAVVFQTLNKGKAWAESYSPQITLEKMKNYFSESSLELEYLQLVNPETMNELNQYWVDGATACIAAFCGEVRLIDNMELVPM